jgi:hypothetical protein
VSLGFSDFKTIVHLGCFLFIIVPDDSLLKPKYVGAFIVYFNENFNILKQIGFALVN